MDLGLRVSLCWCLVFCFCTPDRPEDPGSRRRPAHQHTAAACYACRSSRAGCAPGPRQASSTCSGRALRGGQSGSARLPSEAPGPLAALGGSDPARPSGTWRMRPRCGGACFSAGSKSASNGQQQHLAEEILTKKSFGFLFVCVAFERFVSYAGRQPAASVCVL